MDALRRVLVVQATGCVNVVITAPITQLCRVDPALYAIVHGERFISHSDRFRLWYALWSVRTNDLVVTGRQMNRFTGLAIDLRLEEEVGSLTFGLRGVDAALSIADFKAAHARRTIGIGNLKRHWRRWQRAHGDVRSAPRSVLSRRVFETDPVDAKLSLALKRIEAHAAQVTLDREFDGILLIAACIELKVHLPLTIGLGQLLGPPEHLADVGRISLAPEPQHHLAAARLDGGGEVRVIAGRRQMQCLVSDFELEIIQLPPTVGVPVELPLPDRLRVLRSRDAGVELQPRWSLSSAGRGNLHEAILEFQSTQRRIERATIEGIERQPAVRHILERSVGNRPCLRAIDAQTRLDSSSIQDLDQQCLPAVLFDLDFSTRNGFDCSVLCNFHGSNAQRVEQSLHGLRHSGVIGFVFQERDRFFCFLRQRSPVGVERFDHALSQQQQRLSIDTLDLRQSRRFRSRAYSPEHQQQD